MAKSLLLALLCFVLALFNWKPPPAPNLVAAVILLAAGLIWLIEAFAHKGGK